MKAITRICHQIVLYASLEEALIEISKHLPWFRKFLPVPSDYGEDDEILIERDGIRFKVNRSDYMQWYLFINYPEPVINRAVDFAKDNCIFLDIGSNIGSFSLRLARKLNERKVNNSKIIAFEPNNKVTNLFRMNQTINPDISWNIELYQLAVSNNTGFSNFTYNSTNSGGGRITDDQDIEGDLVELVTLDEFLGAEVSSRVTFMKIDVEGNEPRVLEGAKNLIEKYRPVIYLEVTDEWYSKIGSSAWEVINYFRELNYDLMWETNGSFKSLESLPSAFQFNMLCIPE